ncbi:hypothetical protein EON67_12295 [archaeon]|nr:MAG: hypothetical protein EON67_12295 [archaeon]
MGRVLLRLLRVRADFLVVLARVINAIRSPEAMISAFEVFDPDRKGYVTVAQFRQIMEKLG